MRTKSEWLSFDCFVFKQGPKAPEVATFAIDAYDLQTLAAVSRIADEKKGYQRIINPRKLASIRRYVEIPEAALPTGIVLASGEKPNCVEISERHPIGETGCIWSAKLRIKRSPSYKPLLIIDGQHRLFGIISSKLSPYPVSVTLLVGADKLVQMAHFEIINNKATRISTAHLNELRAMMYDLSVEDEKKLNSLLGQLGVSSLSSSAFVSELNGPNMVFEGILDFPSNEAGFVSSNTLRQLVESSRANGFLKYLPQDDNDELQAYNAVWLGVRKKFARQWDLETNLFHKYVEGKSKKSEVKAAQRLLHSASLTVVGNILDDELASTHYRKMWISDITAIPKLVKDEILEKVPDNFWRDPQLLIDNTSKGRTALRKLVDDVMI